MYPKGPGHSLYPYFCDLQGVTKRKLVPGSNLQEWVEQGAGFTGASIWGTRLLRLSAHSEYEDRVQVDSLQALPFMPGVAHLRTMGCIFT